MWRREELLFLHDVTTTVAAKIVKAIRANILYDSLMLTVLNLVEPELLPVMFVFGLFLF